MNKRIRVGIVGTGFGLYGIFPALLKDSRWEVVGIAGQSFERAEQNVRKRLSRDQHLNVFPSFEELIETGDLDAICIAVPPIAQEAIASFAVKKRISVFAEKPLAASLDSAKRLYELAVAAGVTHMMDFLFPEINLWVKAKDILSSGGLGRPQSINLQWFFESYNHRKGLHNWKNEPSQGGGTLSYFASHAFYNLEFLFGPISHLKSSRLEGADGASGETSVHLEWEHMSGVSAVANVCSVMQGRFEHILDVKCDIGSLRLWNDEPDFVRGFKLLVYRSGCDKPECIEASDQMASNEDSRVTLTAKVLSRTIDWIITGVPSAPNFSDGVRIQEWIENARQIHIGGGRNWR